MFRDLTKDNWDNRLISIGWGTVIEMLNIGGFFKLPSGNGH